MGCVPRKGLDGIQVLVSFFKVGRGSGRVLLRGRGGWRSRVAIVAGGERRAFFFGKVTRIFLDWARDAQVLEVEALAARRARGLLGKHAAW